MPVGPNPRAMAPSAPPAALVVGGGVAGLAVALQLVPLGWRVTILESDLRQRRRGHGLLLPPPARRDLDALGLAASLHGAPVHHFQLCRPDGRLLEAHAIPGSLGVLRRDLVGALVRALPAGVELRCGRGRGLVTAADGRQGLVTDLGEILTADLIVAADGVGSPCRRALFPAATLTPERVSELVFDLPAAELAPELAGICRKFHDPAAGLAIGLVPSGRQRLVLYAQIATARHRLPAHASASALVRRHFGGWNPWLERLLDRLPGTVGHRWHTTDLDLLPQLHGGRVVLVGDAAHPLLPFTSQGVPAALADAACLGEELAALDATAGAALAAALPAALARYSRRRLLHLRPLLAEGRRLQEHFLSGNHRAAEPCLPLVGFQPAPTGVALGAIPRARAAMAAAPLP